MVSIIDYGCGNVSSVRNMLKKIGIQSVVTNCEDEILKSNHIIFQVLVHTMMLLKIL